MLSLPFLAIHSRGLGEVSVTANVNATANSFAKFFVVNDLLIEQVNSGEEKIE
jgi:hypothetical protein